MRGGDMVNCCGTGIILGFCGLVRVLKSFGTHIISDSSFLPSKYHTSAIVHAINICYSSVIVSINRINGVGIYLCDFLEDPFNFLLQVDKSARRQNPIIIPVLQVTMSPPRLIHCCPTILQFHTSSKPPESHYICMLLQGDRSTQHTSAKPRNYAITTAGQHVPTSPHSTTFVKMLYPHNTILLLGSAVGCSLLSLFCLILCPT